MFFFFKQKTAYEIVDCDWSSDVCSSDLKNADYARPDNPDETYNWILQHKNTFDKFKDTRFYKVNLNVIGTSPIDCEIDEWKDCSNVSYITQKEMVKSLDK